jgi:hypothetical protein
MARDVKKFEVGQVYNRRDDIHDGQDGQQINDALQRYLLQVEARSDT